MNNRRNIENKESQKKIALPYHRLNPQGNPLFTTSLGSFNTLKQSNSRQKLNQTDAQISLINQRYKKLEEDYFILQRQAKDKKILFKRQRQQIQLYSRLSQEDKKEIQNLKRELLLKKPEISIDLIRKQQKPVDRSQSRQKRGVSPQSTLNYSKRGKQSNFHQYKFVPTLGLS